MEERTVENESPLVERIRKEPAQTMSWASGKSQITPPPSLQVPNLRKQIKILKCMRLDDETEQIFIFFLFTAAHTAYGSFQATAIQSCSYRSTPQVDSELQLQVYITTSDPSSICDLGHSF